MTQTARHFIFVHRRRRRESQMPIANRRQGPDNTAEQYGDAPGRGADRSLRYQYVNRVSFITGSRKQGSKTQPANR